MHHHTLGALHKGSQPQLVGLLNPGILLYEGSIPTIGLQLGKPRRIPPPVLADGFIQEGRQSRVGLHQPTSVGDTIGDAGELFRAHQIKVLKG